MKIKELLENVASLVECQEIIAHGSIQMLHSEKAVSEIADAEGIEDPDVDTDTIGDDELADKLREIAEDGDLIAELDFYELSALENAYWGDEIESYLDREEEDELPKLRALIEAAENLA